MTQEQVNKINKKISFENKICADKKPYFFGYIYNNLMYQYKSYDREYNKLSKILFGISLKDLLYKKDKTKKESSFVYRYNRYIPVLKNNSIVNVLSKYVESVEFENKWKIEKEFDYSVLKTEKEYNLTNNEKNKIKDACLKYHYKYTTLTAELRRLEYESYGDILDNITDEFYKSTQVICTNKEDLCNYLIDLYYNEFKNKTKSILWNTMGEQILSNIKSKSKTITLPMEDEHGTYYLGKKYSMREIEL